MSKLQDLSSQGHGFAIYPEVRILDAPAGKAIQHLIFGDYITPPKNASKTAYLKWNSSRVQEVDGITWIQVRSRQEEGWIKMDEIQLNRTLEVNFIDVGQGDGCHLVTPLDEHYIIDAGEKDNMYRFLRWRFNLAAAGKELPTFKALISHPDEDHYKGFIPLLSKIPANQKRPVKFDTLYFNGIIQRPGSSIGQKVVIDGEPYLSEVVTDDVALRQHLQAATTKSNYQELLSGALVNYPQLKLVFLNTKPTQQDILYNNGGLSLRVLGPVSETKNNKTMLRWFDPGAEIGKTKNGHSIVLLATIGNMRVLLGGDLNSPAADFLMQQYSGVDFTFLRKKLATATGQAKTDLLTQIANGIAVCQKDFRVVVAKSCHHGSHDITNEFLHAINPIATVISSGDEESFCHPRPETLGAIGKSSRGERPLIYSTELARSSPEYIEIVKKDLASDKVKQRVVSVYGMITLRTDGDKAIIAQKLEKNRSSFGKGITKWQIEKLEWDATENDFVMGKP